MSDPLDLVRKLRAKAQSTTYQAERESLLAKASEIALANGLTEEMIEPPARHVAQPRPQPQAARVMRVTVVVNGGGGFAGGYTVGGNTTTTTTTTGNFTFHDVAAHVAQQFGDDDGLSGVRVPRNPHPSAPPGFEAVRR